METGHGIKYRQLHIEDYLREIPAEQGRETGEYAHERITGNPGTNTDFRTDNLLDTILRSDNLNAAYKKVKTNKGVGGIDGMQVDELLPYLREHQSELVEQVREGKYKPNPVRRVEIPKEGGNAQLGTHQKNHSGQTWLSRYDCPLSGSPSKLLNRVVPNGTLRGVEGKVKISPIRF